MEVSVVGTKALWWRGARGVCETEKSWGHSVYSLKRGTHGRMEIVLSRVVGIASSAPVSSPSSSVIRHWIPAEQVAVRMKALSPSFSCRRGVFVINF